MSTIKITDETKKRLLSLDFAGRGKSFDMIVNDLVTSYEKNSKQYSKTIKKYNTNLKDWEMQMNKYKNNVNKYLNEEKIWKNLLKWARSKGFKG